MRYAIGECIDRGYVTGYVTENMLAQGGFGETYKPLNISTGQTVVLKLPEVAISGDLSAYNRYRPVIEIGQCFDHHGLQRLPPEARLNSRGHPLMVLDVDGQSLRRYLCAHASLPVDEVEAVRRKVQTGPLVRRTRPDVPPQLEAVVYPALGRRPEERYPSVAELGHLDAVTIPARPDIPPPKPLRDLPPWRTLLPVFLVLGLLDGLGILGQLAYSSPPH